MATPADLRTYAQLPSEVPEPFLAQHLAGALRDLMRDSARSAAPEGLEAEWEEAQIVRAYASALPHLHTFTLNGAAKVERLAGAVEFRFMDGSGVSSRVVLLITRYRELLQSLSDLPPFLSLVAI